MRTAQRWLYERHVLPACGGKGERSIMSSCRNVIMPLRIVELA